LWVFFDLGGTLLDEEPFISLIFREVYKMLIEYDIKVHMDVIYKKVEELVFTRRYGDYFFTDIIEIYVPISDKIKKSPHQSLATTNQE